MDADDENIERRANNSLITLAKAQKDVEGLFVSWIESAKASEKNLNQLLASEKAAKHEIEQLRNTVAQLEHERDDLIRENRNSSIEIDSLLRNVKRASEMIGTALSKNRELSKEKHEAIAMLETLKIYMGGADERQEALEAEVAELKALLRDQRQDLVTSLMAPVGTSTSPNDAAEIAHLRDSLGRLQTKYDSLQTRKEYCSSKFYKQFVDWADFKTWWAEFQQFPGVKERVVAFNRKLNGMEYIKGKGRAQKVSKQAQDKLLHEDTHVQKPGNTVDKTLVIVQKPRESRLELESQLQDAQKELEELCGPANTEDQQSRIPPADVEVSSDATKFVNSSPKSAGDDSFDPEKTQETTPGKSQRSAFVFDKSALPPVEPYLQPVQKPDPPLPMVSSPITIKDEPRDLYALLRPPTPPKKTPTRPFFSTTDTINGGASSKVRTNALNLDVNAERSPFATLGKRKQPLEDEPPGKEKDTRSSDAQTGRPNLPVPASAKLHYMKGSTVPLRLQNVDGSDIKSQSDGAGPSERMKRRKGEDGDEVLSNAKRQGASTSKYEVNPARNNGKNFAYEETVRGNARKKLDAGVCDGCRDYYNAVGPMPARAKPPLWRSPTSSQEVRHRCRKHGGHGADGNDERGQDEDDEVAAHRQAISRHRHQWDGPTTPPEYWKIGFPDTQEVANINERAEEMHKKKQRIMEREAAKPDGKYRKK